MFTGHGSVCLSTAGWTWTGCDHWRTHGPFSEKFVGDDAFSAAAAWSVKYDYFYVHLDYLKHNYFLGDQLPVYIGLGGALGFGKDMAVTARVPLGISYLFRGPFDVFFEVVPGLRIIPETDFDVMGAGGFHFYF